MKTWQDAQRLLDDKPWSAHLYVTDQCNLDCHYCNEYDNSKPHPDTADLKRYMKKIRDLGVIHLGFQGGEPLLHPDICELVRYARSLGFIRVSMSTNAFKLTEVLLRGLEQAGLTSMQFSVDRMTPIKSTRKSLKTVLHKVPWFDNSPIRLNVAGVLFKDSVGETDEVIAACLERGIDVAARVIHNDLINDRQLRDPEAVQDLLGALDRQAENKAQGRKIHTSWNLIDYQQRMLRGEESDWTCVGGYKYFFVSAEGKFWLCSQVRTEIDIMDVTPELLKSYDKPKDCQSGCGVYCIADMSLAVSHPARYLKREVGGIARSKLSLAKRLGVERAKRLLGQPT